MKKRIGMILESDYPADIRVFKEANSLIEAGFEIVLLSCKGKYQKEEELVDGINVVRVDIPFFKKKKVLAGVLNVLAVINNFTHLKWKAAITKFVDEYNIEVLHVHDLPLANTALKVARKKNIPIVADFHENYPAGLKTWSSWRKNPIIKIKNKWFFNYGKWLKHEKDVVHKVDKVVAVVEEMKDRLIEQHDIDKGKISVVSNTESVKFLEQPGEDVELLMPFINKTKILYFGYFGPHRGLDTAIKAMPQIIKLNKDVVLLVIGTGAGNSKAHLEEIIENNQLEEHVHFFGFKPFKFLLSYLKQADIAIVPHNKNEHTDHTIPHKLFQFMLSGTSVLVSDCKPLKRVLKKTNGGWIFKAGNENDFAQKIIEIINQPSLAMQKNKNAQNATLNEYNWESTATELIKLYKEI